MMPVVPLYNGRGERLGDITLNEAIFNAPVNEHVIHDAVINQLASERSGTAHTKTISEVSGGGIKPWRQKGTGRARHGSRRSPLWVGGATLFGPVPREYGYRLPKKVRRAALKSALSVKASENAFIVLEGLSLERPRTRDMVELLRNVGAEGKVLVVSDREDPNVELSLRNIPGVKMVGPDNLSVYDILAHDKLLFTKGALARVEEVLSA